VGYLPGRTLGIFIGTYVVLNIVLSAVSFRNFRPNIWFFSSQFETCEYVGNRTGTLSLVNISIAILFAGRNNLLIVLTGWSQTTFMTLHRWTARVATLQAVAHSIVYTLAYFEPGYDGATAYAAKAAEPFYVSFRFL
jgi:predicted ferric reductase